MREKFSFVNLPFILNNYGYVNKYFVFNLNRISLERENNFARAQKLSIKGELLSTEGQTKIIIETIQNSENAKRASDVALFINNDETKTEYPSRKALHLELINVSDERAKTCEQNPKTCPSDFSGDAITNSDQQSIPW